MPLFLAGLSHKSAPVELREKLSFSAEAVERLLPGAKAAGPLSEMVLLSTCNRTEIYGVGETPVEDWCVEFLNKSYGRADLKEFLYFKDEEEMIAHLFRVASGLDSLVLGENEILKQVKEAYHLSQKLGLTGKLLNVLFQRALYVGKLVRTHTLISQGTVSAGSVAVSLAEKIFGSLRESTVLIFGAGKMAEVSARYLLSKKVKKLLVANRTLENARALAEKFNAAPLALEEGVRQIALADVVITSMGAPEPILTKSLITEAMERRGNRSLFLIDIAVPRNIEPAVHKMDNVYLYNIDDLEGIVRENLAVRTQEVERARHLVNEKASEFAQWYRSLQAGSEKSLKHNAAPILDSAPGRPAGEKGSGAR